MFIPSGKWDEVQGGQGAVQQHCGSGCFRMTNQSPSKFNQSVTSLSSAQGHALYDRYGLRYGTLRYITDTIPAPTANCLVTGAKATYRLQYDTLQCTQ